MATVMATYRHVDDSNITFTKFTEAINAEDPDGMDSDYIQGGPVCSGIIRDRANMLKNIDQNPAFRVAYAFFRPAPILRMSKRVI